jgi:hypothetical protein
MAEPTDWIRVRGMGRERFAGYLSDYLTTQGYTVERTESADPAETRVVATLQRMNPAIPESARALSFRLTPTSGGAAVVWETPTDVPPTDRPRLDRMVREFMQHLERAVLTESHATAKVVPPPTSRLPWVPFAP